MMVMRRFTSRHRRRNATVETIMNCPGLKSGKFFRLKRSSRKERFFLKKTAHESVLMSTGGEHSTDKGENHDNATRESCSYKRNKPRNPGGPALRGMLRKTVRASSGRACRFLRRQGFARIGGKNEIQDRCLQLRWKPGKLSFPALPQRAVPSHRGYFDG